LRAVAAYPIIDKNGIRKELYGRDAITILVRKPLEMSHFENVGGG
jgi:hypothetical protein